MNPTAPQQSPISQDVMTRVAAVRPDAMTPADLPDPAARREDLARITSETPEWERRRRAPGSTARRQVVQRRAWLGAASVGMAAVITAGLFLAPPSSDNGGGLGPQPAAAALFEQAAVAAGQQPNVELQPGQFWHVRTEGESSLPDGDQPGGTVYRSTSDSWTDVNGKVFSKSTGQECLNGTCTDIPEDPIVPLPSPQEMEDLAREGEETGAVQVFEEAGPAGTRSIVTPGGTMYPLGGDALTYQQVQELPTDPDALEARMRTGAEKTDRRPIEAEVLVIGGDLLRGASLPSDLRAAIFKVMARQPGASVVGDVTDAQGRKGVAVSLPGDVGGQQFVFQPETGELIAERSVAQQDEPEFGISKGDVFSSSASSGAKVVDAIGQTG